MEQEKRDKMSQLAASAALARVARRQEQIRRWYDGVPRINSGAKMSYKTSELLHLRRLYYIIDKTDLDSIKYNRFQQTIDRTYFLPPRIVL